jgi:predicted DNA-binding transcriptional regulator AlpA
MSKEYFYKEKHIIGDKKAVPPVPAIIPVSRTTWRNGIKAGIYPAPVKLGARSIAWRAADIAELVAKLGA